MACDFGRLLSVVCIIIVLLHRRPPAVSSRPRVPCYFIFGDSWFDNGNNNKLKTKCKVNYPPYGIDFPEGDTGRFSNGRTAADIIGQLLGFNKFIPPYAARNKDIKIGVNYASGCAGIRRETGRHLGDRIFMDRQLRRHNLLVSKLTRLRKRKSYLRKCLYIVNIGSNDYMNNFYLHGIYNTSNKYSKDQYAKVLIQQYSRQLRTLYRLGGRKIVVFGLAEMGCTPSMIYKFGTNGKPCVESVNDAVRLFNDRLMSLIVELNKSNSGARFIFINLASILSPLGDVPLPNNPCCNVREDWQCIPSSTPCPIRDLSIFFDGIHQTEVCNMLVARRSYNASSTMDAYPYDIRHLAELKH
ncbi:GDSL esterase/lipase At2g19010-like [Bidens hawaiensis]|uniref:GDSL esterase/lipase At2g19010-like n=1 Tax=Bidens hawaiensis TaxID=980011 RepID=UPI00404A6E9A